jgi:hypothetical protein
VKPSAIEALIVAALTLLLTGALAAAFGFTLPQ